MLGGVWCLLECVFHVARSAPFRCVQERPTGAALAVRYVRFSPPRFSLICGTFPGPVRRAVKALPSSISRLDGASGRAIRFLARGKRGALRPHLGGRGGAASCAVSKAQAPGPGPARTAPGGVSGTNGFRGATATGAASGVLASARRERFALLRRIAFT